jgi:hypothetical protein
MKLMFILSCSSINSRQHVAAIKNQDSSLKALFAPQKFNFWSVFVPLLASQNSIPDNAMEWLLKTGQSKTAA